MSLLLNLSRLVNSLTNRECGQREIIGPRASRKGIYVTSHVIKGHASNFFLVYWDPLILGSLSSK